MQLANCGLDIHQPMQPATLEYLKAWGRATRRALLTLRASPSAARHGAFAPSCLAHASNLRFSSAPPVRGVRLIDAMHDWYFGTNLSSSPSTADVLGSDAAEARRFLFDECGDLPCSNATGPTQQCPRLGSVRLCNSLCRLARRRRRIRIGLDPSAPGRNVCELSEPPAITVVARQAIATSTSDTEQGAATRHVEAGGSGEGKVRISRNGVQAGLGQMLTEVEVKPGAKRRLSSDDQMSSHRRQIISG